MPRNKESKKFLVHEKNYSNTLDSNKPPKNFPVYFYHEEKRLPFCKEGDELDFKLPEFLVKSTLQWLQNKEDDHAAEPVTCGSKSLSNNMKEVPDIQKLLNIRNNIDELLSSLNIADGSEQDENLNMDADE